MIALKALFLALPVALLAACGGDPPSYGGGSRPEPPRLDTVSWNPAATFGEAIDARNGRRYRTVSVAGQSWMAENLDFSGASADSLPLECYDYDTVQCRAAGRLYTWSQAMAIDTRFDSTTWPRPSPPDTVVRGLCPVGWHLPDSLEWRTLLAWADSADPSGSAAGLRAAGAWTGGGLDTWGFRALPAGFMAAGAGPRDEDEFRGLGEVSCWWTSDEIVARGARAYQLWTTWVAPTSPKANRCNVRCIQDPAPAVESP